MPQKRESCSFWELCIDGSSQAATTRPPLAPVVAEPMNGSAQTFMPTCFMHTSVLLPAKDMPSASSMAVFSFTDHAQWTLRSAVSGYDCMNSVISVEGVPG